MEWFYGILLPKGFENFKYRGIRHNLFRDIKFYLKDFESQPIYIECLKEVVIGKIKSLWIDNNGNLIICGYLTKKCDFNGLAIMFSVNIIDETYKYSDFACALTSEPYFKDCFVIERRKINLLQY
jgi:hypothetical protein